MRLPDELLDLEDVAPHAPRGLVNTPYVVQPVFADATTKLYRGEYTPEQAHEAAVKGVQDLIIEYLST